MSDSKTVSIFVAAAACSAGIVIAVGWLTDLQQVAHSALLAAAATAFLPFVLVAAGVGVALLSLVVIPALGLVAALLGGGGVPVEGAAAGVEAGAQLAGFGLQITPSYYRFLSRIRHPAALGVALGVVLGGLLLWALIGFVIVPGEARTAAILAQCQAQVELAYEKEGRYPEADEQGRLVSLEGDGAVLVDGFDRPLAYEVTGLWKVASYSITSLGYNGRPGGDDLCVSGSTEAMAWVDRAASLVRLVTKRADGKEPKWADRIDAIRSLRCD